MTAKISVDAAPSLETMCSRIYDLVLYPSQPNLIGDLRADAIRLLDLLEDAQATIDRLERQRWSNQNRAEVAERGHKACIARDFEQREQIKWLRGRVEELRKP